MKEKLSRPAQSTEELVAKLETEILPLSEIELHPDNPRIHTTAQINAIAKLIESIGYAAGSMTIQKSRKRLCKGHGVYATLEKLGYTAAEFVVKDFTDEEALLFMIADNKLSELSSWSMPQLEVNFSSLETSGISLTRTGFTMKEIEALKSREVKEDDPPPVSEEEPLTQTGDLWLLGEHRVLCGDSTKAEDVEWVMGGEKADNAFTSPPYAEQRSEQYGGVPVDEYVDWWELVQDNIKAALAAKGSFFVNIKEHCADGERVLYVKDLVIAMKRGWGWLFVDEFCWERPGVPMFQPNRFKNGWEPIFHFAMRKGFKMRHNNIKHSTDDYFQGGGIMEVGHGRSYLPESKTGPRIKGLALPSNVIKVSGRASIDERGAHPASFPLALPAFFIQAFSDEDDIWLEPFLGSGTTLIAADQFNRKCYGIEISPAYCDVIIKRYINHVGTDEDVYVERDGKRLSWQEAQMPQRQKVHVC